MVALAGYRGSQTFSAWQQASKSSDKFRAEHACINTRISLRSADEQVCKWIRPDYGPRVVKRRLLTLSVGTHSISYQANNVRSARRNSRRDSQQANGESCLALLRIWYRFTIQQIPQSRADPWNHDRQDTRPMLVTNDKKKVEICFHRSCCSVSQSKWGLIMEWVGRTDLDNKCMAPAFAIIKIDTCGTGRVCLSLKMWICSILQISNVFSYPSSHVQKRASRPASSHTAWSAQVSREHMSTRERRTRAVMVNVCWACTNIRFIHWICCTLHNWLRRRGALKIRREMFETYVGVLRRVNERKLGSQLGSSVSPRPKTCVQ